MSFEDSHDPLDQMMQAHLSRRLDPELGKAATKFAGEVMRMNLPSAPTPRSVVRGWAIGMLGTTAVAAAVAASLWTFMRGVEHKGNGVTPSKFVSTQPAPTDDSSPLERTVFWRTLDEGTVYIDDDTPARQLRRQQVEELAWTDKESGERKTTYSVPREEVMFVAYDKY